ncbi:MAG TPA: response regulator [Limnobacter sp.]|nr:response regulator [Limnobacter sp.]
MKILLVEDDHHVRWLIENILTNLGHDVQCAADADEALSVMANLVTLDCVVLDRNLPDVSGIALLRTIRSSDDFADLPVIMVTGSVATAEVAEGLASGAQLYLAKPVSRDLLSAALNAIHKQINQKKQLLQEIRCTQNGLCMANLMSFEYRTVEQANQLASTLAQLSACPANVVIGLSELMVNAVEHGNLAIGYAEKSRLLQTDSLGKELVKRALHPKLRARVVRVTVRRNGDAHTITIRDQGDGFDWRPYLDFSPDRAFDLHGRGIAIAYQAAFESIRFLGQGNVVEVTIQTQPADCLGETSFQALA